MALPTCADKEEEARYSGKKRGLWPAPSCADKEEEAGRGFA
jgi:hypothetical protein